MHDSFLKMITALVIQELILFLAQKLIIFF